MTEDKLKLPSVAELRKRLAELQREIRTVRSLLRVMEAADRSEKPQGQKHEGEATE